MPVLLQCLNRKRNSKQVICLASVKMSTLIVLLLNKIERRGSVIPNYRKVNLSKGLAWEKSLKTTFCTGKW